MSNPVGELIPIAHMSAAEGVGAVILTALGDNPEDVADIVDQSKLGLADDEGLQLSYLLVVRNPNIVLQTTPVVHRLFIVPRLLQ